MTHKVTIKNIKWGKTTPCYPKLPNKKTLSYTSDTPLCEEAISSFLGLLYDEVPESFVIEDVRTTE